jgi:hypothetical protein
MNELFVLTEQEKKAILKIQTQEVETTKKEIFINLPYGFFLYKTAKKYSEQQKNVLEKIVDETRETSYFMEKMNAEYDNSVIRVFQFESDETFHLNDQALNNRVLSLLHNNFIKFFSEAGVRDIIAEPKITISRFEAQNSEERLRNKVMEGVNRKIDIEITTTFSEVPTIIFDILKKSIALHGIIFLLFIILICLI